MIIGTIRNHEIFAFSFDDQLHLTYHKFFSSGFMFKERGNVMIQDIDNNGFLITAIDLEKRLRIFFANELCQNE